MKTFAKFTILFLVCSTSAIVTRWAPCCFHLDASGAVTGTVGQLDDGQNRVNGPLSPAQYCIADGAITDVSGRGCILTRESYPLLLIQVTHRYKHQLLNSSVTLEQLQRPVSVLTAMVQSLIMEEPHSGSARPEMMYESKILFF